jgi:hypothetical protein
LSEPSEPVRRIVRRRLYTGLDPDRFCPGRSDVVGLSLAWKPEVWPKAGVRRVVHCIRLMPAEPGLPAAEHHA